MQPQCLNEKCVALVEHIEQSAQFKQRICQLLLLLLLPYYNHTAESLYGNEKFNFIKASLYLLCIQNTTNKKKSVGNLIADKYDKCA